MNHIVRNGTIVCRTKDTSGILRYARTRDTYVVLAQGEEDGDGGGLLRVAWRDGARALVKFHDPELVGNFLARRRSWVGRRRIRFSQAF